MTGVERRRGERIRFSDDVVVFAKGRRITCRGTDLSEGGIGLEPPAKARPGLHLIVDVDLDGGQAVAIEGYIVHEEEGERYRWGVRFHDVSPRVQRLLAAFVERERQQHGVERRQRQGPLPRVMGPGRDLPSRPPQAAVRRRPTPPQVPAPRALAPPQARAPRVSTAPPARAAPPAPSRGGLSQRRGPARAAAPPPPRGARPLPTPAAAPPDVLDRLNTAEQADLRAVEEADLDRELEDALSKLYEQALDAIKDPLA
ncbi:MAG: hypothetical protein CSA65_07780 [Proteobacteria bacterium]|nr:MAG: hypothetical protein CSA65_07780 [Pseudomonadota bacterium]